MVNKNRSAISQRFKEVRSARKLTQKQFADSMGISQGFLSELENGKKLPSRALLIALSEVHLLNEEWLVTGQGEMFRTRPLESGGSGRRIPLLREIPEEFPDSLPQSSVNEMLTLPNAPSDSYAIVYYGDFMAPTIRDQDVVVFQPAKSCESGDIVLIKNFWGTPILRRYRQKGGEGFFSSDNPVYRAFKVDDEIKVIGKVVAVWRNIKY
jgi:SOS-response transcriptional repressor LexA